MKLTDLNTGEGGRIISVPLPRLYELGLTPGTAITLLARGPFGSPLKIRCGGCYLLLDRRTADETEVERCE